VFTPDPAITHLPVTRDQVVAIVQSLNQPQVSIPGKASQVVLGFLVGVRSTNAVFSIYVGLHLPRAGENVVYVHERRQLTVEEYRSVEIEGLHFLESMGFMLDNLNFRNLTPEAQERTFQGIPVFHPPRPPLPAAATPAPGAAGSGTAPAPVDLVKLARLLAAF
jgi:hypothetical protein